MTFAQKIYDHIIDLGKDYDRIDVICDRYFANSLKTQARDGRGSGNLIEFNDNSLFPNDFKEHFLKNSENKEKLNMYLATKFMETSIRRLTLYSASVRPLNIIIM